eukprot:CAMPEP_0182890294 /NCGR_PEP_ID=MMETSP0034_2-20130328/22573_1 /TAXON_ID=156128 /ORGANISM="Nephroselmis pyriformis, Strain CCMP717" /LENGTH=316 /DNA_ID=CAMNT_0025023831 /DNA_START=5 /DNA_END=955 /DNA_ORIENTATION=+
MSVAISQGIVACACAEVCARQGAVRRPAACLAPAAMPHADVAFAARSSFAGRALASTSAPSASARTAHNARIMMVRAMAASTDAAVAKPIVKIDNNSDAFATVVSVQFGDYLGQLSDTVSELKKLGLNVMRAKIATQGGLQGAVSNNTFYVTDASSAEKVTKSEQLEEIRMTIINNMMYYHPEAVGKLAAGKHVANQMDMMSFDEDETPVSPLGIKPRSEGEGTHIDIEEHASGRYSVMHVNTKDKPGNLVAMVTIFKNVSVNVNSAEIDTEGTRMLNTFFLTYQGTSLNKSMEQVVTNSLKYFLELPDVESEDSY